MWKLISISVFDKFYNGQQKPNVIVLGNGYSGHNFSTNLDTSKYNLTIVDKNDYFLETHKMSSKYNPINKVYVPNSNFINGEVASINTNNKTIVVNNRLITYDYLVFALGCHVNTFNIPGVSSYCYFYKTIDDMEKIAKLKNETINIIGGGAVGIELAYKLLDTNENIQIIEAFDILPGFSVNTRDKIKEDLKNKGICLITNCKVNEIYNNDISNTNYIIKTITDNKEKHFYEDNIIWTAGIKCHELKPTAGNDVFIIGDNSNIRPPTGQKAKQEGRWLAKYFNNEFDTKYSDFKFKEKGKIIHTDDGIFIELCDKCTIWLPKYFDWIIYKIIEIL
jgi:NADH dehydrogenase